MKTNHTKNSSCEVYKFALSYFVLEKGMEYSTKTKNRRPIFEKKKSNEESNADKLYQTSPAFYPASAQRQTQPPVNYHSRIIFTPKPDSMYRSSSVAKMKPTINIRLSSPPPSNITQPAMQPVFLQKSPTPQPQTHQRVPQFVRAVSSPKFERPLSHQPAICRQSTPNFIPQNENFLQSKILNSELRPTVVAVERIMRPVGENTPAVTRKPSMLGNSCYSGFQVKDPQEMRILDRVQRKDLDSQKVQKLAQMNNMLAVSYDDLYDELQSLKGDVLEKEVVEENLFLKKTFSQIESIFNFYTVDTIKKMNRMERERRDKSNHFARNQAVTYSRVR